MDTLQQEKENWSTCSTLTFAQLKTNCTNTIYSVYNLITCLSLNLMIHTLSVTINSYFVITDLGVVRYATGQDVELLFKVTKYEHSPQK